MTFVFKFFHPSDLCRANVLACGGSVSACLQPFPQGITKGEGILRHFQTPAFAASDIDLFLYGLRDRYEAASKVAEIYQSVKSCSSGEVACVRTTNAVTIIAQHPERH